MRRYSIFLSLLGLALGGCERSAPLAPADDPDLLVGGVPAAPFEFAWTKTESGPGTGQWRGTTQFGSALATAVSRVRVTGHTWHLETFWAVDLGTRSFDARLDGTLNIRTGRLVLVGRAVSGIYDGRRIQVEGQLTGVDPTTGGTVFEGTLKVMHPFSE